MMKNLPTAFCILWLWIHIPLGYSSGSYTDMPLNHKVFLAQFDAIKKIANAGPCVLVGRCADYALEDNPDAFKRIHSCRYGCPYPPYRT